MNEYIKTTFDEGHDVEKTKRGFIDVKMKVEYGDFKQEYMTSFLSKSITDKTFEEKYMCTWSKNEDDNDKH